MRDLLLNVSLELLPYHFLKGGKRDSPIRTAAGTVPSHALPVLGGDGDGLFKGHLAQALPQLVEAQRPAPIRIQKLVVCVYMCKCVCARAGVSVGVYVFACLRACVLSVLAHVRVSWCICACTNILVIARRRFAMLRMHPYYL